MFHFFYFFLSANTPDIKLKIKVFGEGITATGVTAEDKLREWRKKLKRATECNNLPQYSKKSVTLKEAANRFVAGGLRPKYLPDAEAVLGHAATSR